MSRQAKRRQQQLRKKERQTSPMWLIWTGGGLVSMVALVLLLLLVTGRFNGQDTSSTSAYMLSSNEVAELASKGHSLGSSDAPVTILEFGDFQ